MTHTRLHPTHLPISPPSPPTSHARRRPQKPANWMPEDDDPKLLHIPARYGVPNHDFNWPWYWDMQKQRNAVQAQEEQEIKYRIMLFGLVVFVLGLIILTFIIR